MRTWGAAVRHPYGNGVGSTSRIACATVEGPGRGAVAVGFVGLLFGADGFAEGAPDFVVVGMDSFFEGGFAGEEDVHGIADDASDVEAAAEFAEAAPEGEGEARGLVVFEVVEAGVRAGEANEFVEKEVERGSEALEEFDFGFVHAEAEFALAVDGGAERRGDRDSRYLGRCRPSGGRVGESGSGRIRARRRGAAR